MEESRRGKEGSRRGQGGVKEGSRRSQGGARRGKEGSKRGQGGVKEGSRRGGRRGREVMRELFVWEEYENSKCIFFILLSC